jgi:phasin
MVEQQEFQIPQQLRELAEKSVEQARSAYGQFLDGMAEAVRAWSTVPSAVMTSGFKVVQERAIQFAKENAEAGFALASELAQAKDLQEVLRLQSNFAQKQMQSYARQAQELGRLMAEATRSSKPQGLNAPAGDVSACRA